MNAISVGEFVPGSQDDQQVRMRLALIDDDESFRRLVRRVAEPLGWLVEDYESGAAFLDRSSDAEAPDLAFLDLMMPERDGIETLPDLTERYPDCRVVIVTGGALAIANAASMIGEQTSNAGISVLAKPASLGELRDALALPKD
jgi:CheY-like chemotaxis protein